ncbi:hypothetical protein COO60DRAFT_916077 [Scenedesmus sp. NREL 46B-D3]|nr:hypothetical protein COO60DRAFT_916077 [Scenedesmus sp. NREL 46B-D3]
MVWGKPAGSGVDDLVKRLQADDPQLKSLTIFRFRRLNDVDVAQLSSALQDNTVLQELICCSHAISSEAAARLGAMLQQNRQLQHISIGNSSFGDEALSALVSGGLQQNKSLVSWDLEHKGLSQASGASIAQVLQQHSTLQHVQLSRNSLTDAGLQRLCAVAWAKLTQLQLAACELTHQGVLSLADAPSIGQLQQLDLSHNALGPAAGAGLADLLAKATRLQHLKLKGTQLQDEGVGGVADGLLTATAGLALLDLSSNQLSSAGVAALAAALGRRAAGAAAVQQLVLADNPAVDDEAVCRLAQSLNGLHGTAAAGADGAEQQQLTLDFAHAGVGAGGVAALSKVSGLKQLSLFGCKLGGEQGGHMLAALVMLQRRRDVAAGHVQGLQRALLRINQSMGRPVG